MLGAHRHLPVVGTRAAGLFGETSRRIAIGLWAETSTYSVWIFTPVRASKLCGSLRVYRVARFKEAIREHMPHQHAGHTAIFKRNREHAASRLPAKTAVMSHGS